MTIKKITLLVLTLITTSVSFAKEVVNVYSWAGVIPDTIIQRFEKETGIKVNLSTYENNETMYAKLRVSPKSNYDVILPTSNFMDRLRKQNMLEKIDKTKLSNWHHLNPLFLHLPYDPESNYSVPFYWGTTGIFYNKKYHANPPIHKWSDLWRSEYANELLLLDDPRDVFSMALLTLGYSVNDRDPEHIKQAYLKLISLMKNVKVFSAITVISIIIDDDATLGMAWNGDVAKAASSNTSIEYVYPADGFLIWVDNFAIPKNPPHPDAAYTFINYLLRPEIAKETALYNGFATANLAAQKSLPEAIRNNPAIYPSKQTLKRGHFLLDIGSDTLALYEHYWEELKMGGE